MVTKSSEFIWTGATTDITIRWKLLYGWIPPSENPEIQKKWAEVRTLSIKGIESLKDFNKIKVKENT
jgi:hypothetical protein